MPDTFTYSIHNVVTLSSDVLLPELVYFRHEPTTAPPDIRVRVGHVSAGSKPAPALLEEPRRIVFREILGSLGFAAAIEIGQTTEMIVSPLLRASPHVLYTNLVEPLLRWTFASRGYALVHAACLVFDGGYLITARTDTGKTSTVLRCLCAQRSELGVGGCAGFISDDLTLLCPDGQVLAYPKPLTISHHTARVVPIETLSIGERLSLVVQGRVHSRLSRRVALRLALTRLPMATANALLQWLVPPPKYHVQRLVPGVNIPGSTRLAGLFVIERGAGDMEQLDTATAQRTLLRNSADAFGFPPYPVLEPFLSHLDGRDLQAIEQNIVSQALAGLPARRLRSTSMDWWRAILDLAGGTRAAGSLPGAASPVFAP